MGMFDNIYVEDNDFGIEKGSYQTKDLENILDDYYIRDNRLILHAKKYEWVDDEGAFFGGYLHVIEEWMEDTNHHGDINLYDYDREKGLWVDYYVRFTDGIIVSARREEVEK